MHAGRNLSLISVEYKLEVSALDRFDAERERMVQEQIQGEGICDEKVLAAMRSVRREAFVSQSYRELAYADRPLPIGEGQTISQPFIVAYMIEALALHGGEKVLEIGAGSGYAAAVLAQIAGEVYAIERIAQLADMARSAIDAEGYRNVHILHGDGTNGWVQQAPFDAILVSAGARKVPEALKAQLKIGGRMVIPIGSGQWAQTLVRITRRDEENYDSENMTAVRVVPLIGDSD